MEEKKITDEEVIKALDICYKMPHCTSECPYFNKSGRNFCKDHKLYNDLKRIVQEHAKQQAEIERLEKDVHDMSWVIKIHKYCVGADHCQNSSTREFKLQNQLDELTEELDYYKCANRELTSTNEMLKKYRKQDAKDTAKEIWDDCIDKIMRGCGDDKEFWVVEILVETFKKYSVGFSVEVE